MQHHCLTCNTTTRHSAEDVIVAYFDNHGINDARAGAFNILDRLREAGFVVTHSPVVAGEAKALADLLSAVKCCDSYANLESGLQSRVAAYESARSSDVAAKPSRPPVLPPVQRIEMVTGTFSDEEAPPEWRIMVGEYCIDLPTETYANNVRDAILALCGAAQAAEASNDDGEMLNRIQSAYCKDPADTAENAWNDALEHIEEGLLEHPLGNAQAAVMPVDPPHHAISAAMEVIPEEGCEYEHIEAAYRAIRASLVSSTPRTTPTIDDVPSCGQENDHRRADTRPDWKQDKAETSVLPPARPRGKSGAAADHS